ncbi:DUF3427 domain-containing protein [Guptibacillus hwajinpoensis]|uniref:HNH restriction endonuclease n=1 Tax=Guptibacillus hwajinpoensis TaxID=208199 RepID=A0ABU0JXV7_9BACL|nr:DUF3427 domain-containing protein [Alkalihalobacillus hemicentroti]MDQ0481076.1 putative HNH restriction endonuclease [Alkalihalobacillus hemicentroti]
MPSPFIVGHSYSRKDVYRVLKVSENKQGGNWNTGYTTYKNDVFIFANINSAGRTGHNYDNKFIGDDLQWFSKNTHSLKSPTIQRMLDPNNFVYIFTREDSNNVNFKYQGIGRVKEKVDTRPVKVLWEFYNPNGTNIVKLPEEIFNSDLYFEGSTKKITVNVYERNPVARKKCIEYYGVSCIICGFDFKKKYGDIGESFIHIHHLKELSEIREEYEINPIKDLRPVCPNCHAMLHRRKPSFTIEELRVKIDLNFNG